MACACKVNQEIDKIQKYYSYNGKAGNDNRPKMKINKKDAAITILAYTLVLPLMPIVFVGLLFYSVFSKDKKISIGKILGFIHNIRNGRKEQII
jgi:hypothetical protein